MGVGHLPVGTLREEFCNHGACVLLARRVVGKPVPPQLEGGGLEVELDVFRGELALRRPWLGRWHAYLDDDSLGKIVTIIKVLAPGIAPRGRAHVGAERACVLLIRNDQAERAVYMYE